MVGAVYGFPEELLTEPTLYTTRIAIISSILINIAGLLTPMQTIVRRSAGPQLASQHLADGTDRQGRTERYQLGNLMTRQMGTAVMHYFLVG